MELITSVVGPLATNVYLLADPATNEAIAVDTATPSVDWLVATLERRGWRLKLVVSTHGHWDHIGDNAAVQEHTGAPIAVHRLDRGRLKRPRADYAPFSIPPSFPAIELAEGGRIDLGALRLEVLHTPGVVDRHPFVTCVGREGEPYRIRRATDFINSACGMLSNDIRC